jgi:hypothetical protein
VHDWFAIGLLFAIAGHILLAFRDPDALNGMVHGSVKAHWASKYRPRWYEEMERLVGDRSIDGAAGDGGARIEEHRREAALRAGEMTVVDRVDGRAGDGVGEREL